MRDYIPTFTRPDSHNPSIVAENSPDFAEMIESREPPWPGKKFLKNQLGEIYESIFLPNSSYLLSNLLILDSK